MAAADTKSAAAQGTPVGHAQFVCQNCKTRKKGCDKRLPSCTYCTNHSVPCHYVAPASVEKAVNVGSRGNKLAPTADQAATLWSDSAAQAMFQGMCPSIKSTLLLMDSFLGVLPGQALDFKKLAEPTSVDAVLYSQVCRIITTYGKYVDDISVSYFQGVHRWLPIISRRRFHDRLMNLRGPATADFSVLLLAMCLVTSRPAEDSKSRVRDQETLYLSSKMLFAHAQSFTATSTHLIQAGLLIATYEYAQGLSDAAFVSIGTCARMAYAAGLSNGALRDTREQGSLSDQDWACENHNLWWGIVLCERFIASETSFSDMPFSIRFPGECTELPLELDLLEQNAHIGSSHSIYQPITDLASNSVCSFGREAQAAFLFNSVLEAMRIQDPSRKCYELTRLDSALQEFFSRIMTQSNSTWGLYCGAIAFTIGALFSLHGHILEQGHTSSEFHTLQKSSRAALAAAARMVVDVACSFNLNSPTINTEILPPRCSHLVTAAVYLLKLNSSEDLGRKKIMADIEEIRMMLKCLSRRWIFAGKKLRLLDEQLEMMR